MRQIVGPLHLSWSPQAGATAVSGGAPGTNNGFQVMATKTYFTTSTYFTTYIDKSKTVTKTHSSVR
jgi:hypothetical protein